jgi:hypothetical protein
MKCFKCDKPLKKAVPDSVADDPNIQPDYATMWHSHGNYGSTVFDSIYGEEMLVILICDDCLVNHAKKSYAFKDDKQVEVAQVLSL